MARATRSSVSSSTATKKRKRTEDDDSTDVPPTKQTKSQDDVVDQSIHIQKEEADKILAVLEMIDVQGLLDRVFPLPSDESKSFSFRALLKDCAEHPLSVLQSAVQKLFPISSHPRALPSKPAAQQLRFCQLALSLLNQASHTRLPSNEAGSDNSAEQQSDETSSQDESPSNRYLSPRYALVQHLPQGDYWTSVNSSIPSDISRELRDLPHGHADLVAILPFARSSKPFSSVPNLGSYHTKVLPSHINKMPVERRISRGSFLDYGPYSSFAPTFDQDGTEIGRQELGEHYLAQNAKRKEKSRKLKLWAEHRHRARAMDSIVMRSDEHDDTVEVEEIKSGNFEQELQELLPSHEVDSIKAGLRSLELESAVQELLDRNRKALERLQDLQYRRLVAEGGGSTGVEEGSEEWDTAHGILDSLTILASLRPRSSMGEHPPFVLTPSALHALHRTLPLAPTSGWHGNLPPGRSTALRDDSTVKIRPGVPVPAATVAAPIPTPAANAAATTQSYPSFPYTQAQSQYGKVNAGGTGATTYVLPYKHGASAYYSAQQQGSYYATTQTYAATGHQPYTYSGGWYNNYTPPANVTTTNTAGSSSGTATPTASAPSYTSFFGSSQQSTTSGSTSTPAQKRPSLAVANTVSQNGLTAANNAATPVAAGGVALPLPLRSNGQQSSFNGHSPSTSTPAK
ncbi:hypothetical protein E1B28_009864 [Marasmius oreades]|uniref:Uncharacterized protein n=1 Tax=Marasmius oreades TaxID=181124 RepID=A0A9P7RVZ7_9AGAR|nr:uncharacterized protein E1B28_009864 [Marasmius oreades]KAG7090779.1 hypothetical protein E1B28_009864 [Marasmius oreades]